MRILLLALFSVLVFLASTPPATADPIERHQLAAEALLRSMKAEEQALTGATAMADVMAQSNPDLAPFRDVMLEWATGVMSWDAMRPALVEIYTDVYSESELRELAAFYESPIGQKSLAVQPEITTRSAQIGVRLAQQSQGELQRMIQERAAEFATP